jgi:hypothetical protein
MPASVSLLLGSTEQETGWFMIMQVLSIQRVRDDAKVFAMDILDLIQGSVNSKHLHTKGQWFIEHSQQ